MGRDWARLGRGWVAWGGVDPGPGESRAGQRIGLGGQQSLRQPSREAMLSRLTTGECDGAVGRWRTDR